MPRYWYDKKECARQFYRNKEELDFQLRICADKKPYFMQYIYPALRRQYRKAVAASQRSALYQMGVDYRSILTKSLEELTEAESLYVRTFGADIPVNDNLCVMNRICHMVEDAFCGWHPVVDAGTTADLMKAGVQYSNYTKVRVVELVDAMRRALANKTYTTSIMDLGADFVDEDNPKALAMSWYMRELAKACPHVSVLTDILIDYFYTVESMREFVWLHFGNAIVGNLLKKSGGEISCIREDVDGDFEYGGVLYSTSIVNLGVDENGPCVE